MKSGLKKILTATLLTVAIALSAPAHAFLGFLTLNVPLVAVGGALWGTSFFIGAEGHPRESFFTFMLGTVFLDENGNATFNSQPLQDSDATKLGVTVAQIQSYNDSRNTRDAIAQTVYAETKAAYDSGVKDQKALNAVAEQKFDAYAATYLDSDALLVSQKIRTLQ